MNHLPYKIRSQGILGETLILSPKHIYALREEVISHPRGLNNFDSKEFDSIIANLKGNKSPLPGLA